MELIDRDLLLSQCTVAPPKADEERILTKEELAALKDAIHKHEENYPEYLPDLAIELALMSGMRVGELAALKWSCVDDVYIHIDFSEHRLDYSDKSCEYIIGEPKNRKHRKIPLTKDMRSLFKRIRKINSDPNNEFVFSNEKGIRYSARALGLAARKRCKEAGIKHGSIHRIRRTVSSFLNQDLPQKVVADLLGHSELVNETHYNYSVAEIGEKANALSHLSSVISLRGKNEEKTG